MTVRPTARLPRQRVRASLARPGRVYVILTRPVDQFGNVLPGPPEVGYVGQTRQQVWQRGDQHRDRSPFGDLIVEVLPLAHGVWTDAELDACEAQWIQAGVSVAGRAPQRPRYNHDHNLGNPDRIEVWRAVQQRQHREPGWMPPPKDRVWVPRQRTGGRRPAAGGPGRPRSRAARWWARHRWHVAAWAALWVALTAGAWWAGADTWSGWAEPRNAAVLASCAWALIVWQVHRARRPKRRRRRSGRGRR